MIRPMSKSIPALVALAFACLLASPAHADDADRALLSTFCDAEDIEGSTCKRAKGYPDAGSRACDVKLTSDRHSGRFIAAGNPLLVVNYESGCEPHASDNGGAVVFEQSGGKTIFEASSRVRRSMTASRWQRVRGRIGWFASPGISARVIWKPASPQFVFTPGRQQERQHIAGFL